QSTLDGFIGRPAPRCVAPRWIVEAMKPAPRSFFVASFGRSGTVWLSKLLNAHPEVLCLHEGAMMHHHPKSWQTAGMAETLAWISSLLDLGEWNVGFKSYCSVGDVNSIGGFHRIVSFDNELYRATSYARLSEALELSVLYALTREPIASIESKYWMIESHRTQYMSYARAYMESVAIGSDLANLEWWPRVFDSVDTALRVMLMLHWRFVAQL